MEVLTAVDVEAIRRAREGDGFVWVDLTAPGAMELQALAGALGLHPAAVEDSVEWDQRPKLDFYGDHLTLVFFSAVLLSDDERLAEPLEVHLHLAGDFAVTIRRAACGLDHLHDWLRASAPAYEDEIVYHLLDALADGWDPVVAHLESRVDSLEQAVLERTRSDQLRTIYRLKQTAGELSHYVTPQREVLRAAVQALHDLPGLTRGSREWLRDVTTHVDAVAGDLHRIGADLRGLTDTFFNANANRLNRIAALLAVGGTFFLIWTLITSFFGQNFGYLVRSIDSRADFLAYGVGGLVLPSLLLAGLLWWRRDDWWQ